MWFNLFCKILFFNLDWTSIFGRRPHCMHSPHSYTLKIMLFTYYFIFWHYTFKKIVLKRRYTQWKSNVLKTILNWSQLNGLFSLRRFNTKARRGSDTNLFLLGNDLFGIGNNDYCWFYWNNGLGETVNFVRCLRYVWNFVVGRTIKGVMALLSILKLFSSWNLFCGNWKNFT